jgi:hypothetical protein
VREKKARNAKYAREYRRNMTDEQRSRVRELARKRYIETKEKKRKEREMQQELEQAERKAHEAAERLNEEKAHKAKYDQEYRRNLTDEQRSRGRELARKRYSETKERKRKEREQQQEQEQAKRKSHEAAERLKGNKAKKAKCRKEYRRNMTDGQRRRERELGKASALKRWENMTDAERAAYKARHCRCSRRAYRRARDKKQLELKQARMLQLRLLHPSPCISGCAWRAVLKRWEKMTDAERAEAYEARRCRCSRLERQNVTRTQTNPHAAAASLAS